MADISLENVTKVYGDGVIGAEDVNIIAEDGEFIILVGPSGCGKTTTLEMIAGLQRPTRGTVKIGGEVMNERPPQDRNIAMVFQDYALYPHKTVRGNMIFGLKYTTDKSDAEMNEIVEETATLLGIEPLLDQKPGQLSGGQQQRVALGRAIVRDPEVFLLDEPLSNLDAKLRTEMRAELQRLQNDLDVTTVYVTHDQTEAMTMGDKIVVMNEGHVQQVGTPIEVYNEPSNVFVGQFIGSPSLNVIDAEFEGSEVRTEVFDYQLETTSVEGHRRGKFGVRPEDIEVTADEGPNVFEARVDVVEQLGNENLLHLSLADDLEFIARVPESVRPDLDDVVTIRFPENRILLFDEDGQTFKMRDAAEMKQGITRPS